jgi:hypothetical protein
MRQHDEVGPEFDSTYLKWSKRGALSLRIVAKLAMQKTAGGLPQLLIPATVSSTTRTLTRSSTMPTALGHEVQFAIIFKHPAADTRGLSGDLMVKFNSDPTSSKIGAPVHLRRIVARLAMAGNAASGSTAL